MVSISQKFGTEVRRLRIKKDLSQEQLAEKADLDLTSISEIESGLRNPSLRTMHKISRALGYQLRDILTF